MLAVTFGNYPRPIVATADKLLAARDTCEQCHWSAEFHGDYLYRPYTANTVIGRLTFLW